MSDSIFVQYIWLVPAVSLLAAVITAIAGNRWLKQQAWLPCMLAAAFGAVWSALALVVVAQADEPVAFVPVLEWLTVSDLRVAYELLVDPLSALMLFMVTFVGSLIVAFASWYMAHEEGYARFFSEVALFLFSMTSLVLVANLLMLYVFWELVGLCSYLLIGFYYTRPCAAAAAKKAFVVNRIGDFGFALGIFLIWVTCGTLSYRQVLAVDQGLQQLTAAGPAVLTTVCLLLFCGAVGKSAQFPLHVWLPDAMEGPTPVSALIHAATMVTAGVYMVARFTPLFAQAAGVGTVVLVIGCVTAFIAAFTALTQTDFKRILAYSTISQLGYMFMALGIGTVAGAVAAIFHVFTHAFFKALLFLGSGSVMHATGGELNVWRMGGLRKYLPVTHWTFLCAALALAGFPLLSGFWSKDAILATVWQASGAATQLAGAVGLITAALTAFYIGRAYFLVFWGEPRDRAIEEQVEHYVRDEAHGPPEPLIMKAPLIVLAVGSVLVGAVIALAFGGLVPFLAGAYGVEPLAHATAEHDAHGHAWGMMLLSAVVALAGLGLAYVFYGQPSPWPDRLAEQLAPLYRISVNKFWLDELGLILVVRPMLAIAAACRVLDNVLVDGLVHAVAAVPAWFARLALRPMHNGLVPFYALAMLLGLAVILTLVLFQIQGG